jgi:hypothetical protein
MPAFGESRAHFFSPEEQCLRAREAVAQDEKPGRDRLSAGRTGHESAGWGEGHLESPELGSQLETDAAGQVRGLENLPYVDADAVHAALPVMWERNDAERERLNREKPPGWEERMKALDADAERMARMREQADETAGSGRRDGKVRNLFYEGAANGRSRAESSDTEPERARERYARLRETIGSMDEILRENQKIIDRTEDALLGGNAEFDARAARIGFFTNMNRALALRKQGLNAKIADIEHSRRPENLDVRARQLRRDTQNVQALVESKRGEIRASGRASGAKTRLQSELEAHERAAVNAQKKLDEWMSNPVREQAVRARAEEFSESESAILEEMAGLDRMIADNEERIARAEERTHDLVSLFHDQMRFLVRERAKADRERTDAFLAMTAMR